jgi:hypothetical protein
LLGTWLQNIPSKTSTENSVVKIAYFPSYFLGHIVYTQTS